MRIIGHRGASYEAPENTVVSTLLAWQQSADAVEFDIRLTRDGEIVAIHDNNTLRTTGVEGVISALALNEIQQLDAGGWKGSAYIGEKIPALTEMIAVLPADKQFVIELKVGTEILEPLQKVLGNSDVAPSGIELIGFNYAVMRAAKALMPQFRVLWLDRNIFGKLPVSEHAAVLDKHIQLCRDAGFDGLDLSSDTPITRDIVQQLEAAGLSLYIWTVNDIATAQHLDAAGIHGLTTDRPGWMREQLHVRRS